MKHYPLITVVIATLGGKSLISMLTKLNSGSVIPKEILVCIPEGVVVHSDVLSKENVRLVVVPCRGQVAQRAFGFQMATYEYVMQMDDDLFVDHHCLEHLVRASQIFGPNVAVSPALINKDSGGSVYKRPEGSKLLIDIYFWLMNGTKGYQPGSIDSSGSAVGVDSDLSESRFIKVEWLAGGCVLHRRKNLVLEDFWSRPGKAYYEDLLHSHILSKKEIILMVDTLARCELEIVRQSSMTFRGFMSDFCGDFFARRYYMKKVSRSSARMYIYYFIRFVSYAFGRIRSRWHVL